MLFDRRVGRGLARLRMSSSVRAHAHPSPDCYRCARHKGSVAAILLLAGFAFLASANGQGFVNAVPARARVFPELNSGIAAIKRDRQGLYYILATPANVIWVFSNDGHRIGRIPGAGPDNDKIQYAVDFDLDSNGRILVADRAANAIEIFSPAGSFLTKVPVFAPTGVVALPNDEFAVSTFRSKRLVEIHTEQGTLVRSFGDPAEAGADPDSQKLQILGKISGDGSGDIFFAFTALPDPTVRKYDRYGYVTSEATFASNLYNPAPASGSDDRVQFGLNFSSMNFTDSYNAWVTIGNRGDVFFGSGLSPGLRTRIGGMGGGPGTAQSATENLLSAESPFGPAGGGPGPGPMPGGGMLSAQGSFQHHALRLHVGNSPPHEGPSGSAKGAPPPASSGGTNSGDAPIDGSLLLFDTQDSSFSDNFGTTNSGDLARAALSFSQPVGGQGMASGSPGGGFMDGGMGMGGGIGMGMGGPEGGGMFGVGAGLGAGLASFGTPGGSLIPGGFGGGLFSQGVSGAYQESAVRGIPAKGSAGAPLGVPASFSGRPSGMPTGPRGHIGPAMNNVTATIKVNLDRSVPAAEEKPVITAVGIDPVSQDIWAAVGRVLVHFDKSGGYLGEYFIATPDGAFLRASAILVDTDRLIIASETRGIYEFESFEPQAPRSFLQAASTRQSAPLR
jgi:hypothetical protein